MSSIWEAISSPTVYHKKADTLLAEDIWGANLRYSKVNPTINTPEQVNKMIRWKHEIGCRHDAHQQDTIFHKEINSYLIISK